VLQLAPPAPTQHSCPPAQSRGDVQRNNIAFSAGSPAFAHDAFPAFNTHTGFSAVHFVVPQVTGTCGETHMSRLPMKSEDSQRRPVGQPPPARQTSTQQSSAPLHPMSGSAVAKPGQHFLGAVQSLDD
jgi:hypothetical protein